MNKKIIGGIVVVVVLVVAGIVGYNAVSSTPESKYEAYMLKQVELGFKSTEALQKGNYAEYERLEKEIKKLNKEFEAFTDEMRKQGIELKDSKEIEEKIEKMMKKYEN